MPINKIANESRVAAAVLALKAHAVTSTPEILPEINEQPEIMQRIAQSVDLTEAPEDAVCGLVIDLLHYCEREKIDWNRDVISRAWEQFRSERAYKAHKL